MQGERFFSSSFAGKKSLYQPVFSLKKLRFLLELTLCLLNLGVTVDEIGSVAFYFDASEARASFFDGTEQHFGSRFDAER